MEPREQSVILFMLVFVFIDSYECSRIIIVEDAKACFRRVLAGKCIDKSFVRRSVHCERVEDCQHECANEKRFVCEGFNYRLDPTGRGQGDCELLDVPISRLNLRADVHNSRDYDYYERDRNTGPDCKPRRYPYDDNRIIPPPLPPSYYNAQRYPSRPGGYYGSYGTGYSYNDRRYSYDDSYRKRDRGDYYYYYGTRDYADGYRPPYRRGDSFRPTYYAETDPDHHHHHQEHHHHHLYENRDTYDTYEPFDKNGEYDYKAYEPYLPPRGNSGQYDYRNYGDRDRTNYWGLNRDKWGSYGGYYGNYNNYPDGYPIRKYLPPKPTVNDKDWGQYGGSYGHGDGNFFYVGYKDSSDYWGLLDGRRGADGSTKKPYYPHAKGEPGIKYLPPAPGGVHVPPDKHLTPPIGNRHDDRDHADIRPPHAFDRPAHNFVKDECSLRTATGFRLHKSIVRRFYSVPNIYECEMLCYKETEFQCRSYAFRYTISLSAPTDNCYLTDKDYKTFNFYTEVEPDRDFDVYAMNNRNRCEHPMIKGADHSDCFWHVRSGQRLDHKVVRDTLTVKSIVDCQIECLRAMKFICRAFSFRFGSPIAGKSIDNCQLTDWPYIDLEPIAHMIPEIGFEIYDRGSYGHGCEPDHFSIRGKYVPEIGAKTDQLCYVGYGTPARLLPQAVRKALKLNSEFECRLECTKLREETLFQCMSFSYCVTSERGAPNCFLSDIYQRDLLSEVDYVSDPDSWLFAWDNYNPKCVALTASGPHIFGNDGNGLEDRGVFDLLDPQHVWRAYSVNGYPCRRGTVCEENREAGFWFCYLEGGDRTTWDYCCRPNHQCGYSLGYAYQWCYVGPSRTQWRQCNDHYYPYNPHFIDRHDVIRPSLPPITSTTPWSSTSLSSSIGPSTETTLQPPRRTSFRPDVPPPPSTTQAAAQPSLDHYEQQFQLQFLDAPRPPHHGDGFGRARHWPVAYLHKELPYNESNDGTAAFVPASSGKMRMDGDARAIQNVIQIIRNDLDEDGFGDRRSKTTTTSTTTQSPLNDTARDIALPLTNGTRPRGSSSLDPLQVVNFQINNDSIMANRGRRITTGRDLQSSSQTESPTRPFLRRGYVTRTNVKNHGRQWTNLGRDRTEYRIIV